MYKVFIIGLTCGCATGLKATDPYEIMSHSIKLAEANWSAAPHYSFTRTDVNGEEGSPSGGKTYRVLMIDGSPYQKIIAEAGHELSPAAAREEDQKFQRELDKRQRESPRERRKRIQKYSEERERDHAFLTEIGAAFEFSMPDDQSKNSGFWLVEAKPKRGYDSPTREGKVLAAMNVRFWIDKATCQWRRIEAQAEKPVSIYGLLAKVNPGARFTLEQEQVSANVWLPSHFTMQVNATALGFIKKDTFQDQRYSNYRRIETTVGATSGLPGSAAGVE